MTTRRRPRRRTDAWTPDSSPAAELAMRSDLEKRHNHDYLFYLFNRLDVQYSTISTI